MLSDPVLEAFSKSPDRNNHELKGLSQHLGAWKKGYYHLGAGTNIQSHSLPSEEAEKGSMQWNRDDGSESCDSIEGEAAHPPTSWVTSLLTRRQAALHPVACSLEKRLLSSGLASSKLANFYSGFWLALPSTERKWERLKNGIKHLQRLTCC